MENADFNALRIGIIFGGVKEMVCKFCNAEIKEGALFCTKCGKKVEQAANENNASKPEAGLGNQNIVLTLLIVCTVILFGVAIWLGIKVFVLDSAKEDTEKENVVQQESTDTTETTDTEEVTEAANPLEGVTFDLTQNKEISLVGSVTGSADAWVLAWTEGISCADYDAAGTVIRVDGAVNANIDESALPENMMESILPTQEVTITGIVHITNNVLCITPSMITDASGVDMIAAFEEANQSGLDADYIIPYSDTVLLTEEDVEDLTLQEINYAKNEIYARHGRKFASPELQNYFNSKSWYKGTIGADDFDKNSSAYLSGIENKNAAFLSSVEKDMGTYQLDK
jgi:hypothetical protein